MASSATLSVQVSFDNGPKIESKGKLDSGSYVYIDEDLCRCSQVEKFDIFAGNTTNIEMIVITATPYAPEKETCPSNGTSEKKRIKFGLADKNHLQPLNGPLVLRAPFIGEKPNLIPASVDSVWFENQMPLDAKVSVLVVRAAKTQSAPPAPAQPPQR